MRKMASIRKIDKIEPIDGADKIVKATVGGWQLVTAIDNGFKEGDLVCYFEIDSWIPTNLAPFLSKGKDPREFNGIKGERLKTIKLRGVTSQGLIMPIPESLDSREEGLDLTEVLGIQKWEKPINPQLAGTQRGNFPSFIPKTDQERIQNLKSELDFWVDSNLTWEVSEKCEGSSMTAYLTDLDIEDGYFGVCSRNMDLIKDESNTFWKVAIQKNIEEKLRSNNLMNLALQGELVGPGVQGNIYDLKDHLFLVFDIYDIKKGDYYTPIERRNLCEKLEIAQVPILRFNESLSTETMESLIKKADGKSILGNITGPKREGLVYKCNEAGPSFKVISNAYLMSEKD